MGGDPGPIFVVIFNNGPFENDMIVLVIPTGRAFPRGRHLNLIIVIRVSQRVQHAGRAGQRLGLTTGSKEADAVAIRILSLNHEAPKGLKTTAYGHRVDGFALNYVFDHVE